MQSVARCLIGAPFAGGERRHVLHYCPPIPWGGRVSPMHVWVQPPTPLCSEGRAVPGQLRTAQGCRHVRAADAVRDAVRVRACCSPRNTCWCTNCASVGSTQRTSGRCSDRCTVLIRPPYAPSASSSGAHGLGAGPCAAAAAAVAAAAAGPAAATCVTSHASALGREHTCYGFVV